MCAQREKEMRKIVDDAVEKAKKAPLPPDDFLHKNIYKDPLGSDARAIDSFRIPLIA